MTIAPEICRAFDGLEEREFDIDCEICKESKKPAAFMGRGCGDNEFVAVCTDHMRKVYDDFCMREDECTCGTPLTDGFMAHFKVHAT